MKHNWQRKELPMNKDSLSESKMQSILAMNLKYLRLIQYPKVSQTMLARILHLPLKTIQNYEARRSPPTAYAVFLLARYYGCSMEELLTTKLYLRKDKSNEK